MNRKPRTKTSKKTADSAPHVAKLIERAAKAKEAHEASQLACAALYAAQAITELARIGK